MTPSPPTTTAPPQAARPKHVEPLSGSAIVVGAVVVVALLVLAGRYGWHRDELYFVACGRHLTLGYVDQPPFTPAVARLSTALFGTSLLGLRLLPAVANGIVVVLAAVIARELGGHRRAQTLAAIATAGSSVILALGHLLSTATFDILVWTALTAVFARLFRSGNPRWWLVVGLLTGIGLENKYTVVYLLGAIAIGLLLFRRDALRDPWLWAGAVIALVIWAPNLAWQASHGWPVADMSRTLHTKGVDNGNMYLFLPMQLVFLNPAVTPLWIVGLVWSVRSDAGRPYRPIGVAWVVLAVAFIVTAGKPYYIVGLYPFLLAAGSVWVTARWRPPAVRRYSKVAAVVGVLAAPLALPVLPISVVGSGPAAAINPEFRESYGWPEFARTVEQVPGTAVFTLNYGEASALRRFAPSRAVYSGHNNYWLWGPPPDGTEQIVVVGHFSATYLAQHFNDCRRQATIGNPANVPNQERGAGVWSCAGPAAPWHREWPSLKHYSA